MFFSIGTISPFLCLPPGTMRILWSYHPSTVWLTIAEPSTDAFLPTMVVVQAQALPATSRTPIAPQQTTSFFILLNIKKPPLSR